MEDENFNEDSLNELLNDYPPEKSSLIPILQASQDKYGYLPRPVMKTIAKYLSIPVSTVHGVSTFYAQFRFEPIGKHVVKVCHGTACHVKGADKINETIESKIGVKSGETTEDGLFTLERVACIGCCSLAPVIMVDGTAHGNLDRKKVKKVIQSYREGE